MSNPCHLHIGTLSKRQESCKLNSFSALSFLPEKEVIPAFEALEEKFEGEVPDSFVGYFEKNYIGKHFGRKKVRKDPTVQPDSSGSGLDALDDDRLTDCPQTQNFGQRLTDLTAEALDSTLWTRMY